MRVLDRAPRAILSAPFERRHWRALRRAVSDLSPWPAALVRYVSHRGRYPWTVSIDTPIGRQRVTLHSSHDLLTVVEIFCRRDYGDGGQAVVVDVGANMGLAALFFLTRRRDSFVECYEPDERNAERLCETLKAFDGRYGLTVAAVTDERVQSVRFRVDIWSGRYGHVDDDGDRVVPAVFIGDVVEAAFDRHRRVDLVKLDTEGTEERLLAALPRRGLEVVLEGPGGIVQWRRS